MTRLTSQLEVILEAQRSTAKSQVLIDQHVMAVAALKKQNDMLRQAQQLAKLSLKKQEEASDHKLLALEVWLSSCHCCNRCLSCLSVLLCC